MTTDTLEIGNYCVYCLHSVAYGSSRYVNRTPADRWDGIMYLQLTGYICAECSELECDRCGKPIPLDEDIYVEEKDLRLHWDCATKEEQLKIFTRAIRKESARKSNQLPPVWAPNSVPGGIGVPPKPTKPTKPKPP